MTACVVGYAYSTSGLTLKKVHPSTPGQVLRAFPLPAQGRSIWDWSRATYERHRRPPGARSLPGGVTLRKVSLGWPQHQSKVTKKSKKVAHTPFQEDSASSQPGTRPRGGRERRHLIPRQAAGPTSGSLPLPPSAPPPPASTKPSPRRGPGLQEAAGTRPDRARRPASRAAQAADRGRAQSSRPGRKGRACPHCLRGAGAGRCRPGPPPWHPSHPRRPGATHAAPPATPEVAAAGRERPGRPGRGGPRARRGVHTSSGRG